MDCCETSGRNPQEDQANKSEQGGVSRRSLLKGVFGTAAGLAMTTPTRVFGQNRQRIRLAFCSQLLCVVPYEFTKARGFFADEGLDVELVYTRGGNAAMQAMVGGAVDYAATSFDVAIQAYSNGAQIARFATTGRLPLFALSTSPNNADQITEVAHLEGKTVGISALGNSDHALLLFLLDYVGADSNRVNFATLGPNLFDALRVGQIDAGMVQEPALSLLQDQGAQVLFNAMDIDDATRYLGGPYEFMGVAVRRDEREERMQQMQSLGYALGAGLRALKSAPTRELVDALPDELIAGGDEQQLRDILARYRDSLYPDQTEIDQAACERVQQAHLRAGMLDEPVDLNQLLDRSILREAART